LGDRLKGDKCRMNELRMYRVVLYFETNAKNYDDAYDEFLAACDKVRIAVGDCSVLELVDENQNIIDEKF
jgi:hypothetical protein